MAASDYQILEWLGTTTSSRICRALRYKDQARVLLKFPRTEGARLRRECELLHTLDIPGIARPLGLAGGRQTQVLVLQDFPGESLETVLSHGQIKFCTCLRFAESLARALDGMHLAQVVHGDIRPANILIDVERGEACIVDVSVAASDEHEAVSEEWIYRAPELRDRPRGTDDYLTDFYPLGVMLYRMLTGSLPFAADEPSVVSRQRVLPPSPSTIVPHVPEVVSAIVMKLLAPVPEERYQSALGLQFDLEQCVEQWTRAGEVQSFTLGTRDISDRKRAEELRHWLATIVESSSDAIIGETLDGVILSWNMGAERIYGYSATEAIGRPITMLVPAERFSEVPRLLERVRRGERIENHETRRVRSDGRQIDVSLTISPIKDATGTIMGASTIARDISDRKRAEDALRESEERYRIVAETATDAIITIDERGTITYINSAATKIFGYAVAEMRGQDLSMLMPPRMRALYKDELARYLHTGRTEFSWQGIEMPGLHRDGREIPLEVSFGEFHDNGRYIFTGIVRDISDRKRAEELQRWLATMVESSSDAIIGETLNGTIMSWNRGAESTYGYSAAEVVGKPASILTPSERAHETEGIRELIVEGKGIRDFETVRVRKDGARIDISLTVSPILDSDGTIMGVSAIARDISDRKRAEETLREREERIRGLVNSTIIGILFFDLSVGVIDANDAFLLMTGYTRDDMLAKKINWNALTPAEYGPVDRRARDELLRNGSIAPYEKELMRRDGSRVPILIGAVMLEGSQEKGIAFVLDVSERRRAEERIRHMAQHDALTGLPNRVLFQDRVTQAVTQARRLQKSVAVLFIDLDHFKDINDSLGHQVGDRLLRMMARRVQQCLREGDSVARLGGDEFVICLPSLDNQDAASLIAGKVLEALRRPFVVDEHELHVSGSVGISLYPPDGEDVDALMRAADTAMYHAKEKGRDNYQFFTPRLNEVARRRLTIANRLHHALQRGEFAVHYQPQIDLDSGRIFSAEALVRCRSPELEQVSCSEIIKVCEETGLIATLGERVLREVCEQTQRWRASGYCDLRIAVNLSPYQFRRPGFPALLASILKESGVPATALELEITESILMMQSEENTEILAQLAHMGMRLAIDDFGTGYSSLAYLQRFPINSLKIDQSFVNGIGRDANDTAIVRAIIAMASSLHLQVIAEGVETAEQMAFLKQHGCLAGQGYFFSHAVAAEAFTELLQREARQAAGVWSASRY